MVHCKIFVPTPKLVTVVFARLGVAILPEPTSITHVPTPTVGVLPASVVLGEAAHKVWFGPADATIVLLSTCMLMVDILGAQTPFVIDH